MSSSSSNTHPIAAGAGAGVVAGARPNRSASSLLRAKVRAIIRPSNTDHNNQDTDNTNNNNNNTETATATKHQRQQKQHLSSTAATHLHQTTIHAAPPPPAAAVAAKATAAKCQDSLERVAVVMPPYTDNISINANTKTSNNTTHHTTTAAATTTTTTATAAAAAAFMQRGPDSDMLCRGGYFDELHTRSKFSLSSKRSARAVFVACPDDLSLLCITPVRGDTAAAAAAAATANAIHESNAHHTTKQLQEQQQEQQMRSKTEWNLANTTHTDNNNNNRMPALRAATTVTAASASAAPAAAGNLPASAALSTVASATAVRSMPPQRGGPPQTIRTRSSSLLSRIRGDTFSVVKLETRDLIDVCVGLFDDKTRTISYDAPNASSCLSLLFARVTVILRAPTAKICMDWVHAFGWLKRYADAAFAHPRFTKPVPWNREMATRAFNRRSKPRTHTRSVSSSLHEISDRDMKRLKMSAAAAIAATKDKQAAAIASAGASSQSHHIAPFDAFLGGGDARGSETASPREREQLQGLQHQQRRQQRRQRQRGRHTTTATAHLTDRSDHNENDDDEDNDDGSEGVEMLKQAKEEFDSRVDNDGSGTMPSSPGSLSRVTTAEGERELLSQPLPVIEDEPINAPQGIRQAQKEDSESNNCYDMKVRTAVAATAGGQHGGNGSSSPPAQRSATMMMSRDLNQPVGGKWNLIKTDNAVLARRHRFEAMLRRGNFFLLYAKKNRRPTLIFLKASDDLNTVQWGRKSEGDTFSNSLSSFDLSEVATGTSCEIFGLARWCFTIKFVVTVDNSGTPTAGMSPAVGPAGDAAAARVPSVSVGGSHMGTTATAAGAVAADASSTDITGGECGGSRTATATSAAPAPKSDAVSPRRSSFFTKKSPSWMAAGKRRFSAWKAKRAGSAPVRKIVLNLAVVNHDEQCDWVEAFRWLNETKSKFGVPFNVEHVSSLNVDMQWAGKELSSMFSIGKRLGKGAFCEVYECTHTSTKSKLAVKVFHDHNADMKNEIDILKKCRHMNTVSYFGCQIPETGKLYVLMEYCDAGSLADLLKRAPERLCECHIAYILRCTLLALRYLHSMGIVHRDVKAANILLTKGGVVKLTDFGISSQIKIGDGSDGLIAGSPLWMAPEALTGGIPQFSSDVWSLGITAYELTMGRAPRHGLDSSFHAIARRTLESEPPQLPLQDVHGANLSEELRDFVDKCLVKDVDSRATIEELLAHPFVTSGYIRERQSAIGGAGSSDKVMSPVDNVLNGASNGASSHVDEGKKALSNLFSRRRRSITGHAASPALSAPVDLDREKLTADDAFISYMMHGVYTYTNVPVACGSLGASPGTAVTRYSTAGDDGHVITATPKRTRLVSLSPKQSAERPSRAGGSSAERRTPLLKRLGKIFHHGDVDHESFYSSAANAAAEAATDGLGSSPPKRSLRRQSHDRQLLSLKGGPVDFNRGNGGDRKVQKRAKARRRSSLGSLFPVKSSWHFRRRSSEVFKTGKMVNADDLALLHADEMARASSVAAKDLRRASSDEKGHGAVAEDGPVVMPQSVRARALKYLFGSPKSDGDSVGSASKKRKQATRKKKPGALELPATSSSMITEEVAVSDLVHEGKAKTKPSASSYGGSTGMNLVDGGTRSRLPPLMPIQTLRQSAPFTVAVAITNFSRLAREKKSGRADRRRKQQLRRKSSLKSPGGTIIEENSLTAGSEESAAIVPPSVGDSVVQSAGSSEKQPRASLSRRMLKIDVTDGGGEIEQQSEGSKASKVKKPGMRKPALTLDMDAMTLPSPKARMAAKKRPPRLMGLGSPSNGENLGGVGSASGDNRSKFDATQSYVLSSEGTLKTAGFVISTKGVLQSPALQPSRFAKKRSKKASGSSSSSTASSVVPVAHDDDTAPPSVRSGGRSQHRFFGHLSSQAKAGHTGAAHIPSPAVHSQRVMKLSPVLSGDGDISEDSAYDVEDDEASDTALRQPTAASMGCTILHEDVVELGVLGRGQNGKVAKALHLPSLSLIAVKSMNVHDRGGRHQLVKELTAFSKLSCPYIVSFLGAYFHAGAIVLASEYMDLGSLAHFVKRNGPLNETVIRHIAVQFVSGLAYLHSKYQIHRDIKPDNVLLDHHGRVKIADFGLLKELSGTFAQTDTFLGTMSYLSPERIVSNVYGYPSDIWALGMSIIFCAEGRCPMPMTDYWELSDRISKQPPPMLDPAQFSEELCDFVKVCLMRDPLKRATAAELLKHPFLGGVTDTSSEREWRRPLDSVGDIDRIVDIVVRKHFQEEDGSFMESREDSFDSYSEHFQHMALQFDVAPEAIRNSFERKLKELHAQEKPAEHERAPEARLSVVSLLGCSVPEPIDEEDGSVTAMVLPLKLRKEAEQYGTTPIPTEEKADTAVPTLVPLRPSDVAEQGEAVDTGGEAVGPVCSNSELEFSI